MILPREKVGERDADLVRMQRNLQRQREREVTEDLKGGTAGFGNDSAQRETDCGVLTWPGCRITCKNKEKGKEELKKRYCGIWE